MRSAILRRQNDPFSPRRPTPIGANTDEVWHPSRHLTAKHLCRNALDLGPVLGKSDWCSCAVRRRETESHCLECGRDKPYNRQGSGAQTTPTGERANVDTVAATEQKRSAFASPAAKGYAAPTERTPNQSKPRRAPTMPSKTDDRDSRTEPPRRQTCRSRCSPTATGNAAPPKPTKPASRPARRRRPCQPPRSDHKTDAETSRADDAATVRHNRVAVKVRTKCVAFNRRLYGEATNNKKLYLIS